VSPRRVYDRSAEYLVEPERLQGVYDRSAEYLVEPERSPGYLMRLPSGKFVDIQRGKECKVIPPSSAPGLCPHKINPMSCPTCFREKSQAPRVPEAQRAQPAVNPVIAAVRAQQPDEPRRTKLVGKMPVPVSVQGMAAGQPQSAARMVEPFDYATAKPGRTDSKGVWHPAAHRSLIDSLPRRDDVK
jgi:hypothetical protein